MRLGSAVFKEGTAAEVFEMLPGRSWMESTNENPSQPLGGWEPLKAYA